MTADEDKRDYGFRLKKAREAKGWDHAELARQIGIEPAAIQQTIRRWETAQSRPNLFSARKLKELLGVEPPTYAKPPKKAPRPAHIDEQDAIAASMWVRGRPLSEILLARGYSPWDGAALHRKIIRWLGRNSSTLLVGWKGVQQENGARYKRGHVWDRGPWRIQRATDDKWERWLLIKKDGNELVHRYRSKFLAARQAERIQLGATPAVAE